MSTMNDDRAFLVSAVALGQLYNDAKMKPTNVRKLFRQRAYQLIEAHKLGLKVRYRLSGQPLNRTFAVGVADAAMAELYSMVDNMGLPAAVAGELVACADLEGLSNG